MAEKSAARSIVNVDLFTNSHRITCQVEVGGTGLIGLLNDPLSSIFSVRNAYFSRVQQPAKIIANFDEAHLLKANIALGLVPRREDLGPQGYLRPGTGKLLSGSVLMAMELFEVRGTLEFISRIDPNAILTGGTAKFTVLYNATVVTVPYPDLPPYSANALFINRGLITSLGAFGKGKA